MSEGSTREAVIAAVLLMMAAVLALGHPAAVAGWGVAVAIAWLVRVPTPLGRSIALGPGVLLAACPVLGGLGPLAAVWMIAAAAWLIRGLLDRRADAARSDVVAAGWLVAVFVVVAGSFDVRSVEGHGATVVALIASGVAWFVARNVALALDGRHAVDTSSRHEWLAGVEEWRTAVTVLAPGALFGLSFSALGWWAGAVAVLLHGFGHLTALRHGQIARTYDQTIRAMSQIPEVADLVVGGHGEGTAALAGVVARRRGMAPPVVRQVEHAALLHDVGAIAASAVGDVRTSDRDLACWGAQIVGAVPTLAPVARIIADHGLSYRTVDGAVTDLAPGAAIVRVAAAYQQRVAAGNTPLEALQELFRGAAYDYDPDVVHELRVLLVDRDDLDG